MAKNRNNEDILGETPEADRTHREAVKNNNGLVMKKKKQFGDTFKSAFEGSSKISFFMPYCSPNQQCPGTWKQLWGVGWVFYAVRSGGKIHARQYLLVLGFSIFCCSLTCVFFPDLNYPLKICVWLLLGKWLCCLWLRYNMSPQFSSPEQELHRSVPLLTHYPKMS